jgi:thiazole biosynthesis enzyme
VVDAGPAGLTAAYYLAKSKIKTTVLEKKLSLGGGIWGGAAGFNMIVVEDKEILDEIDVAVEKKGNLYTADAVELATALGYKATKAGAQIFNLLEAEDVILIDNVVRGAVVNNTAIRTAGLHVDPFCISSKYLIDATGHAAEVVGMLKKREPQLWPKGLQEGFMDVAKGEAGVVEKAGEIYPGLYVAGMSVCTVFNLPRMGPIFGGMLKSGKKVAELIIKKCSGEKVSSS